MDWQPEFVTTRIKRDGLMPLPAWDRWLRAFQRDFDTRLRRCRAPADGDQACDRFFSATHAAQVFCSEIQDPKALTVEAIHQRCQACGTLFTFDTDEHRGWRWSWEARGVTSALSGVAREDRTTLSSNRSLGVRIGLLTNLMPPCSSCV